MTATSTAPEQVGRLLALLPYLLAHPGARVDETARLFGVSRRQLVRDLHVLWFSGLPGLGMGDYIEVDMDAVQGEGVIRVSNAEYLSRPLRLAADEAAVLLVALRTLGPVAGDELADAVARTAAKLEAAASAGAQDAAERLAVDVAGGGQGSAPVRAALSAGRRLRLAYWSPARDETTERDVDPMRLVLVEGRLYLEGWCRTASDVRLFRLDRVQDARVLDVPAQVPATARPRDLSAGPLSPPGSGSTSGVALDLDDAARWVEDSYPTDRVEDLPGGGRRVWLRVGDPAWVRRLALRLGESVRVVEPVELAEEVAATARAALAAYDDDPAVAG